MGGGVAVMLGVCCLGVAAPWPPGALTLALSRRAGEGMVVAGEGTVVVLFGLRGDGGLGCWKLTLGGIGAPVSVALVD